MSRIYFDPDPKDLARCITAWCRSWDGNGDPACQPSASLSRAYRHESGQLRVELRNANGFLGAFSVTPKRVSFLGKVME
ncbi:hypothetical protein [Geothrix sp.]|jgi:hypothetical protein|uniref:hypothetical protein n=1 Tax=Geothrix sp. TaxID=1962974 RepID=UPI0025B8A50B|nr:hypothetical protein [Geothrix sp.]